MNLIEAIKSGKPFRRKSLAGHGWLLPSGQHFTKQIDCEGYSDWTLDGILADDWEIQEPTVTITRAQFWEAIKDASGFYTPYAFEVLARKLGLED